MDKPQLSICVTTFNRLQYTKMCLDSILKQQNVDFEILIWDDASTDDTPEYLKKLAKSNDNISIFLSPIRIGMIKAVNYLLFKSQADIIIKLDNDFEITTKKYFTYILNRFKDKNISIFTGNLGDDNKRYILKNADLYGGLLAIRKNLLNDVGYFNEEYGMYGGDDIDYGYRVRMAGYKIASAHGLHIVNLQNKYPIVDKVYDNFKIRCRDAASYLLEKNKEKYLNGEKSIKIYSNLSFPIELMIHGHYYYWQDHTFNILKKEKMSFINKIYNFIEDLAKNHFHGA